jgi:hypothetical protein
MIDPFHACFSPNRSKHIANLKLALARSRYATLELLDIASELSIENGELKQGKAALAAQNLELKRSLAAYKANATRRRAA